MFEAYIIKGDIPSLTQAKHPTVPFRRGHLTQTPQPLSNARPLCTHLQLSLSGGGQWRRTA
jgi:hypothetical protein